jgi:hypothetical protein
VPSKAATSSTFPQFQPVVSNVQPWQIVLLGQHRSKLAYLVGRLPVAAPKVVRHAGDGDDAVLRGDGVAASRGLRLYLLSHQASDLCLFLTGCAGDEEDAFSVPAQVL